LFYSVVYNFYFLRLRNGFAIFFYSLELILQSFRLSLPNWFLWRFILCTLLAACLAHHPEMCVVCLHGHAFLTNPSVTHLSDSLRHPLIFSMSFMTSYVLHGVTKRSTLVESLAYEGLHSIAHLFYSSFSHSSEITSQVHFCVTCNNASHFPGLQDLCKQVTMMHLFAEFINRGE
jgi:hypothetical protein